MAVRTRRSCAGIPGNRDFQLLAQRIFQLVANIPVFLQERSRILSSLAHALAAEAQPSPALLHQPLVHSKIEQIAFARYALAIDNVKLRLAEWRDRKSVV